MVTLQAKNNLCQIAHIKKRVICSNLERSIPDVVVVVLHNSILQHDGDRVPQELLPRTFAQFGTRGLRYRCVGMLSYRGSNGYELFHAGSCSK
jgi:hypothetical protein